MKRFGREKRHKRITKKMRGIKVKPRLVVFKSKKHIYTQLVIDSEGKVLTGFSTLSKEFKAKKIKCNAKEAATQVGLLTAQKALALGVKEISFDRSGFKFHGRIKALAEGARKGGLKF